MQILNKKYFTIFLVLSLQVSVSLTCGLVFATTKEKPDSKVVNLKSNTQNNNTKIKIALTPGEKQVIPNAKIPRPKVTVNALQELNKVISFSKTIIEEKDQNRIKNINMALNSINGNIIAPNETFSFNKTVGPRLEDYGYTSASTIVKGYVTKDIGGGICQVASTLYEAVLKSDLDIIERHPHTILPIYTAPGKDATVVYGEMDLRFINSSSYPIYISATNLGSQISISLLSSKPMNTKVDVITKLNTSQNIYYTYRIFNNDVENKVLISEDEYPQISILK